MKLYHWKADGIHLMVAAEGEDAARSAMVEAVNGWRWQNPARFDVVLAALQQSPCYEAAPGHVITLEVVTAAARPKIGNRCK